MISNKTTYSIRKLVKMENGYILVSNNFKDHIMPKDVIWESDINSLNVAGEEYKQNNRDWRVIGATNGIEGIPQNSVSNKLSLVNCKEIEHGIDFHKMFEESYISNSFNSCITEDEIKQFKLAYRLAFLDTIDLMESKYVPKDESFKSQHWYVEVQMEVSTPTPFVRRKVVRELDNKERIEWTCFWDNGWWSNDGVSIPNVIHWEKLPKLDKDKCLILKPIQDDQS